MKEPNWLLLESVVAIHKSLVAQHGGIAEIRDRTLLESALARPQNRFAYEPKANLFDLAASYAYGLARNHAFVDGNKRISITAVAMFLADNDYEFAPEKLDALQTFLRLAAGEVEEADLARWIEKNSRKKKRGRRS